MTVLKDFPNFCKCMKKRTLMCMYYRLQTFIRVNMLGNISKRESSLQGSQDQQETVGIIKTEAKTLTDGRLPSRATVQRRGQL